MKLMEKKNKNLQKSMHCDEKMKMVWKNKCKDDAMKNKFIVIVVILGLVLIYLFMSFRLGLVM